jgi:hypothetical protein
VKGESNPGLKRRQTHGGKPAIGRGGKADLSDTPTETDPDFDRLCIKVGPRAIKELLVNFPGTATLEVSVPLLCGKEYRIGHVPRPGEGK